MLKWEFLLYKTRPCLANKIQIHLIRMIFLIFIYKIIQTTFLCSNLFSMYKIVYILYKKSYTYIKVKVQKSLNKGLSANRK